MRWAFWVATQLRSAVSTLVGATRNQILRSVFGMDIGRGVRISPQARLDLTHPRGVHIGDHTVVDYQAALVTRDPVSHADLGVRIGKRCFIGARSMILPGVSIGDGSIVSPGAVVTKDVPQCSRVAGHPAKPVPQEQAAPKTAIKNEPYPRAEAKNIAGKIQP